MTRDSSSQGGPANAPAARPSEGSPGSATPSGGVPRDAAAERIARLEARVAELQRERDHLVAVVDILQEISSSLHFVDIQQAIARKLGE